MFCRKYHRQSRGSSWAPGNLSGGGLSAESLRCAVSMCFELSLGQPHFYKEAASEAQAARNR